MKHFEGGKQSLLTENAYIASLEDNPVPIGSADRVKKIVPTDILKVRHSDINRYGVTALKNLETGIRLGSYEGILTDVKTEIGNAWKLQDGKFIDATDETTSNYLRFVNCARTQQEENLEAFECKDDLYYKTKRNILKGDELLVFYGISFAENSGIDMKTYYGEEDTKKVSRPRSKRTSASTYNVQDEE
ncbi:histone-lysine N-methyltransferase PRDM7-like [Leptinotarsa decemlineata]|uniref:histone-lysine N-methyltransferase PRDM7-like n=1 Tax=Leptinotarsa decemlineata TaxID=7539 RepID=UPI003D309726